MWSGEPRNHNNVVSRGDRTMKVVFRKAEAVRWVISKILPE
jgi:hypothetical protein